MKKQGYGKIVVLALTIIMFLSSTSIVQAMYDPQLMRFTARDPVRGEPKEPLTLHKYLYCQNNSLNWTDPSGRLAIMNPVLLEATVYFVAVAVMVEGLSRNNDRLFDAGLALASVGDLLVTAYKKVHRKPEMVTRKLSKLQRKSE